MRKLIGTCTIILVIYLGIFGSKRFNIEPFIVNWFNSDSGKQVTEKVENKVKEEVDKGIDTIKENSKNKLNEVLTQKN